MKYCYLHVWAAGELDPETKVIDRTVHPPAMADIGLELNDWPADDLFQAWPVYFASNRLCAKIYNSRLTGVKSSPVKRIKGDYNFSAFYANYSPDRYLQLIIGDQVGKDDFALFNGLYLIVSEPALVLLRNNHVTHAEADEITLPFEDYFAQEKHKFWLSSR